MNLSKKEINKLCNLSDFLHKQASKKLLFLINRWNLRWFRLLNHGKNLVYYETKPMTHRDYPKGIFDLTQITDITTGKEELFSLNFLNGTKVLKLKA